MPTAEEYLLKPVAARIERLASSPDDLARTIGGFDDATLSRRPEPRKWSAKEVVCHLRDIEELVILRFHMMLAAEDPRVFVAGLPPTDLKNWGMDEQVPFPLDPDRWADERQYLRNDAAQALAAFRRRRKEVLTLLNRLSPEQWRRGCILPDGRRVTFENWTAAMASHDDNHIEQAKHALQV